VQSIFKPAFAFLSLIIAGEQGMLMDDIGSLFLPILFALSFPATISARLTFGFESLSLFCNSSFWKAALLLR